jgi:hypothetical protein
LSTTHPQIAKEWHPTKNGGLRPEEVTYGSELKVWWQCQDRDDHSWQASPNNRTNMGSGCPYCNSGWTLEKIRAFVASLKGHLNSFGPAELYLLFQQNGLLEV